MARRKIYITRSDATKLEELLKDGLRRNRLDHANLLALKEELQRAKIVAPTEVTPDVVTMHSTVRVRDQDGEESEVTLVFPEEADPVEGRVSVVAPMGVAMLGYKAGDKVKFRTPGGERQIEILEVVYQPEAAGQELQA